ncbi:nuclear transport factor 2 family protein [Marinobacterium sp. YM272]|uniref:nuclear transport factor 2 family protein n=1 Tax=Marinobacterium sp. YM272 TaxID=3421654 RepID=UPI003D7F86C4
MSKMEQTLERYCELIDHLAPDRLDELQPLVTADIHFRDPFNDVTGWPAMRHVLEDMFEQCGEPRFRVSEQVLHGKQAYIRWVFEARLPVLGEFSAEGVSRLAFDHQGLISEHLDYWDSGPIYLRLPVIGGLLRRVYRRIAA